jgi:hypothetical protein
MGARVSNSKWLLVVGACTGMLLVGCGSGDPSGRPDEGTSSEELAVDDVYTRQVAALDAKVVEAVGKPELARIAGYLRDRLVPGDVIDEVDLHGEKFACVEYDRQPSFKKLAAAGEAVPSVTAPSSVPQDVAARVAALADEHGNRAILAEQKADHDCPSGTVPVRQVSVAEVASYGSLKKYLAKPPPAGVGYEYAHARRTISNYGAATSINIWSPYVSATGAQDHSISQMWVSRGSGTTLETVEAGWVQRKTGSARLFIFTTSDGYGAADDGNVDCEGSTTSCCWNADCAFIQNSGTGVYLDGTFDQYSVSGGAQREARYFLFKDNTTGDWWFNYQGTWVGRWPRSIYDSNGIRDSASKIDFGGEVYDDVAAYHTFTDMGGDGAFSSGGYGHAAYQNLLQYATISGGNYFLNQASSLTEIEATPSCYDATYTDSTGGWGAYLYFGGPGYGTNCTN